MLTSSSLREIVLAETGHILKSCNMDEWSVVVDDQLTSCSAECRHRTKQLVISGVFLDNQLTHRRAWEKVDSALFGVIAEALTPGAGHGIRWRRMFARLVWKNAKPMAEKVLRNDCYCWDSASDLLRYAKGKSEQTIRKSPPRKKRRPSYPRATKQLHVVQDTELKTCWIIGEGPRTYLCAESGDPYGRGKRTRYRRSEVFHDLQEAVQQQLHDIGEAIADCHRNQDAEQESKLLEKEAELLERLGWGNQFTANGS